VQEAVAYSTLALTVALAVSRPRLGLWELRFSPGTAALAGVAVFVFANIVTFTDMAAAAALQWRPLLTLTCIMVMTGVVQEVGAFNRIARSIEVHARRTSPAHAFTLIFLVSAITPSLLNNDAAVLLLTPLVVALTRRLYPDHPEMTIASAFAVFLAPGVAPFVISNPMNMIVAGFAGIGFNAYARVMGPIFLVGGVLTFTVLRIHFRGLLASARAAQTPVEVIAPHRAERASVVLLLAVFAAYPVMAAVDGPIWGVSFAGAIGSLLLAWRFRVAPARQLLRHVSPDILVFLWGVFLLVIGLRHVGVVARLAHLYEIVPQGGLGELGLVGGIAALGSALVDNHPMALLNMMALGARESGQPLLAALIGGDIGPRLLPIGSLAGLLWMDILRREGIEISLGQFVRLGTLVLLPSLTVSVLMLWLFG